MFTYSLGKNLTSAKVYAEQLQNASFACPCKIYFEIFTKSLQCLF